MSLRRNVAILLPELKIFARSLGCAPQDVDDVAHSAIERALKAPNPPEALEALRPWMFRTIRNLYIDVWRRRSREVACVADLAYRAEEGAGGHEVGHISALVRAALSRLDAPDREILLLVDVLGLKYAETAEVLDIPIGTVMSRVSRARKAMIAQLDTLGAAQPLENRTRPKA